MFNVLNCPRNPKQELNKQCIPNPYHYACPSQAPREPSSACHLPTNSAILALGAIHHPIMPRRLHLNHECLPLRTCCIMSSQIRKVIWIDHRCQIACGCEVDQLRGIVRVDS